MNYRHPIFENSQQGVSIYSCLKSYIGLRNIPEPANLHQSKPVHKSADAQLEDAIANTQDTVVLHRELSDSPQLSITVEQSKNQHRDFLGNFERAGEIQSLKGFDVASKNILLSPASPNQNISNVSRANLLRLPAVL